MERNEIINSYVKKVNRARKNIIGLTYDMYTDELIDESSDSWHRVIDLMDKAEDALTGALLELKRIKED